MSGHTPGPWEAVLPGAGADWIVRASDRRIFLIGDALFHPENEANARLIAASPDLFEAAKDVAHLVPGAHKRLKAAIAKAEGR